VLRLAVVPITLLAAVGLAACGTIDGDKLADEIESGVSSDLQQFGVSVGSVSCPDDEESETGNTFDCTVTTDTDTQLTVNVEVTDGDDGEVEYEFAPDAIQELAVGVDDESGGGGGGGSGGAGGSGGDSGADEGGSGGE
jgi:uncharacterized membrane protein YgcG